MTVVPSTKLWAVGLATQSDELSLDTAEPEDDLELDDDDDDDRGQAGTHIEVVDGMSIKVQDGFHLERNESGGISEVPNNPSASTGSSNQVGNEQMSVEERESLQRIEPATGEGDSARREPIQPSHSAGDSANSTVERQTATPENIESIDPEDFAYVGGPLPFSRQSPARMNPFIGRYVSRIAIEFRAKTGIVLVVTSGVRDYTQQGTAMYVKFQRGDIGGIGRGQTKYANKAAHSNILAAYNKALADGVLGDALKNAVSSAVAAETKAGRMISSHLTGTAVDFQTLGMTEGQIKSLIEIGRAHGAKVIHEATPPHVHMQFPR